MYCVEFLISFLTTAYLNKGESMYPKFNLYCYYPQFNHMYAPKYFDWVTDGSGVINFWVDDYIMKQPTVCNGRADMAMLAEAEVWLDPAAAVLCGDFVSPVAPALERVQDRQLLYGA